jgi:dihydroflavonol-4-reductase
VARQLVASGDSVRVLVRRTSNLHALDGLATERFEGDLNDTPSLQRAMAGVRHVFHVAADYRLWTRNPSEIYETNVQGTRRLLEIAAGAGVERFVYTSTVATIAVPQLGPELPNEETRATLGQMIGHYKRSKFLAELEVIKAAASGFPAIIVNPTAPVGPADWKPTPTGRIILDFLNGKMPAYVDTGLNLAPIEDVAMGHLLACQKGRIGERYILGARNMTLKQILEALAPIAGRPAPRLRLPHAVALAAKMSRHKMFVESDKAERELGYKPGSVEAALARAVRWYIDHGYVGSGSRAKPLPHAEAA